MSFAVRERGRRDEIKVGQYARTVRKEIREREEKRRDWKEEPMAMETHIKDKGARLLKGQKKAWLNPREL